MRGQRTSQQLSQKLTRIDSQRQAGTERTEKVGACSPKVKSPREVVSSNAADSTSFALREGKRNYYTLSGMKDVSGRI